MWSYMSVFGSFFDSRIRSLMRIHGHKTSSADVAVKSDKEFIAYNNIAHNTFL